MDGEVWAALIGAVSGVISAGGTAILTTRGAAAALRRDARRNAQYLAVQVSPILRQLASSCLSVSYDDGTEYGRPSQENGDCAPTAHVEPFKPNEIAGVDWKSLPSTLMVDVLTFEEKRQEIEVGLADWDEYWDPPDHPSYFLDRQSRYAELGLQAVRLGVRLFKETGHTSSLPGAEEIENSLIARESELARARNVRDLRLAEIRAREESRQPFGDGLI